MNWDHILMREILKISKYSKKWLRIESYYTYQQGAFFLLDSSIIETPKLSMLSLEQFHVG